MADATFASQQKISLPLRNNSGLMRVILNVGINTVSTISAAAQLLNATVSYIVGKAATPLPRVYFGTDQVVGSESLYSMAQCDPDLSPAECHSCLSCWRWW
jgi:hypothetical protein